MGKWVVSGNEGLTEEGVFVVSCLHACLSKLVEASSLKTI